MAKESILTVTVLRGTVVVDGAQHAPGADIKLPEAEARRLVELGVVALPEVKASSATPVASATSTEGPSVTSSTQE